jgi:sugar phosphate isomerase/epimerase
MSDMAMELGVLATLSEDKNQFEAMELYGVHVCQLCNWNIDALNSKNAKKILNDMEQSKVRISAFWAGYSNASEWNPIYGPNNLGLVPPGLREQRIYELKRGIDFASEIGVSAVTTHCGFIPETSNCQLYKDTLKAIEEVARYCLDRNLEFWFECGQETPITLMRTIHDLQLPNLGINFDTANLVLYGRGNSVDAVDIFGKYIKNLHIKDGFYPTDGYHNGKHTPVGRGSIDFKAILKKLKVLDFQGELIVEREIKGAEQARDIMAALKYITDILTELEQE